jgi:hypothetical protein
MYGFRSPIFGSEHGGFYTSPSPWLVDSSYKLVEEPLNPMAMVNASFSDPDSQAKRPGMMCSAQKEDPNGLK